MAIITEISREIDNIKITIVEADQYNTDTDYFRKKIPELTEILRKRKFLSSIEVLDKDLFSVHPLGSLVNDTIIIFSKAKKLCVLNRLNIKLKGMNEDE